jgi:ribosome assembly protein YihI (activator of Der GTPase)
LSTIAVTSILMKSLGHDDDDDEEEEEEEKEAEDKLCI